MSEGNSIRAYSIRDYRGGGWNLVPQLAQAAFRISDTPGIRSGILGVRLVEEVEEDQAPMLGSIRVSRGGSWSLGPQYARVARRRHFAPGYRYDFLGVRLVEEVDEEQTPASGSRRGILGSTWYSPPQFARAAARGYDGTPGARGNGLGVRLVEEVEEDQTPASGSNRVLRGSSWGLGPRFARVARRDGIAPGRRYDILGVRLVEEVTDA